MSPLDYNAVAGEFDRWKAANPSKKVTLSEYAQMQDMAEGTPMRQAAYNDNFLKRANAGIDKAFAPLGDFVAPVGASIDDLARMVVPSYSGNAGEQALRGTPRTMAEFAGYLVPGAGQLAGGAKALSTGLKLAGMADAGLKGYSETDSPLVGAISAASIPGSNAAIKAGEGLAAKYLTRGLAGEVGTALKTGGTIAAPGVSAVADQLATFLGGNAGGLVANEATRQATGLAQGEGLTNPLTVENVVGNIAGLAPFAPITALDVFRGNLSPSVSAERAKILGPYEAELRNRDAINVAGASRDFVTGAEQSNTSPLIDTARAVNGPTAVGEASTERMVATATKRSMEDYVASRKLAGEPPATNPSMFDYDHPALWSLDTSLAEQAPGIAKTFAEAVNIGKRDSTISTGDGIATPYEADMMSKWKEQIAKDPETLAQMRPEDVNTVEALTKFIGDVNQTLQTVWDAQTTPISETVKPSDYAKRIRAKAGIVDADVGQDITRSEVTAFNPLALKELQSEGKVPTITPEWLQKTFGVMLDRSLLDTPQDAYWHTVQKVANLMSDLGVKAKEQKAKELQARAELQSSTRAKTEPELETAAQLNIQQLPKELQAWVHQQSLIDRKVEQYGSTKTLQSVWPFRRDLIDQAVKNLDRTTGMTTITISHGQDRTATTLTLPLEQAVKGVQTVQTPEGPKEVSFIKRRALRTDTGYRRSVKESGIETSLEGALRQEQIRKQQMPAEQDISDVAAEQVANTTREVKDFGEGPEVVQTPTQEAIEPSRSFNEQDQAPMQGAQDVIREELDQIYKRGSSTEVFGKYANLFEGRMPDATRARMRQMFGKAVQATLTDNPGLKREFAAEWMGKPGQAVSPLETRDALRSFWGGAGQPRYEAFVKRLAELTGLTPPQAMASGLFSQVHGVFTAQGELPELKEGLQKSLTEHALVNGMGPEAQAHFVATGMKFVDLFKGLDAYKFAKISLEDPLSREAFAQKVSEDLQVAGLHGMAYLDTAGNIIRNPWIGIALEHSAKNKSDSPFFNWLTLSAVGHEAIHSIDSNLDRYAASSDPDLKQYAASYKNMFAEASALNPQERYNILQSVARVIVPPDQLLVNGAIRPEMKGYMAHGANNPREFIPVYAQMYFSGLVTSGERLATGRLKEHMRWESPAVQDFMRGVFRQIGDFGGGINQLVKVGSPFARTDLARTVEAMHMELPKLVRKDSEVAKAEAITSQVASVLDTAALSGLSAGAPKVGPPDESHIQFMKIAGIDFSKDTAARINESLGLAQDTLFGQQKKLNLWTRNFMPFVQAMARTGTKVGMDAAMTLLDSNRGRTNISNQLLMPTMKRTEYGQLTTNKEHPLRQLMAGKESPERVSFNAIGDLLQALGDANKLKTEVVIDQTGQLKDGFSQLRKLNPALDAATGEILAKATPESRGKVLAAVDSALEIYHTGGNILIKSQQDHMGTRIARVMQTIDPNVPYDAALQRGSLLMQGVAAQNKAIVDQAVAGLQPQQAASLVELAVQLNGPIQELQKMVAERPFFMSEQRQGQYIITSQKNNQRFVDSADNEAHVTKVGQHLKSLGHTDLQWFDKYARYGEFAGELPMQYADKFAQLEQVAYAQSLKQIAAKFGQPVADALLDEFSPIKAVQKDLAAQGVNKLLQERRRVPAALGLDYVRNLDAYIQSMSVSTSNRSVRDRIGVMMADKSVANAPELKPMVETQLQNTLRRGDQTTQQVKTMLTAYYLAGNLGSMFVEGAQTLGTLVPGLIQNGASVAGAYGKVASAMKDVISYRTSPGALNRLADSADSYLGKSQMPKDVEKAYYYRRWLSESPDAGSHLEDNTIVPDQSAILAARNRNGNAQDLPLSTLARNGLYQLSQKSLKAYGAVAQFNNKASFLAAFEHAQEQGLSGDAAFQSARQLVYGTMFGGGRANSANYVAKLSMSPYMRPIVALQSTLSTYSLGMTSLLGSLAHDAILGDKTLNPLQRKQAQKAFGVAFSTQLALAGGLGMPFAAAGLAIVEKLFGVQANAAVRQGLASLAGDDEELGGLFADVALNGAANQLGFDVGGRTGLSSVLGTSAYSGFSFKDLLGPAPSVMENMANATLSLAQGEVAKGITSLLPQSFKRTAELIDTNNRFGQPQIMDKGNNLIMEPSNMQAVMYAMGLQPSKLKLYKQEQQLMRTADDAAQGLRDREFDSLAEGLLRGDTASVMNYLQQQRLNNPAVDPRSMLHSIADRAVSMQQPKDLLAGGNPQSWQDRAKIASTFPGSRPAQSELQRLLAREQILGQMGHPFGSKPAGAEEYSHAAMLDQMTAQGVPTGQAQQKLSYLKRLISATK